MRPGLRITAWRQTPDLLAQEMRSARQIMEAPLIAHAVEPGEAAPVRPRQGVERELAFLPDKLVK